MDVPDVAACVMVRNEALTFGRLAASLRGIADYLVVVDTGSTDATLDVVRGVLADLPGEVHQREWVNFGHNRTELLGLARGKARWLLLIDADQQLAGQLPDEPLPTADAFLLRHLGTPVYRTPRLIRGDLAWRYVGVVHEYLDTADGRPYVRANLDDLWFEDFFDGGYRHDDRTGTLEQDRALLEAAVARDPRDARSWFYLGRTYQEMGRPDDAIRAYRNRAELGGWAEEAYYSRFQVGHLLVASGQVNAAIEEWLAAWELRPRRLEAVHAVIRQLRIAGRYRAALALADAVADVEVPDDILFVHADIWQYELPLERSICSYYVEGPRSCLEQSTRLLSLPDLPDETRGLASGNAELCRRQLAGAAG